MPTIYGSGNSNLKQETESEIEDINKQSEGKDNFTFTFGLELFDEHPDNININIRRTAIFNFSII